MNKELAQLTGLELLTLLLEGKIPAPSMGITMGFSPIEAKLGFVKIEARPDERHLNPMGGVHGGFIATALDTVTGLSIQTRLKPGEGYGTIDLNVKMLRPLKVGQVYFAESRVINISKNLAVSDGKVYDEAGKVYGYGSATCMILRN